MRRKIVAGNWKMHGSRAQNQELILSLCRSVSGMPCDLIVCPPYPYLTQVGELLPADGSIMLGAQNVSEHAVGAFTGEVSASMLVDLGCRCVIVGHSERRALYGELDDVLVVKVQAALSLGLVPIYCLGETLAQRQSNNTLEVIFRQLDVLVSAIGIERFAGVVLAYEPVWAIGTGLSATPEEAQLVHCAIRDRLSRLDAGVADGVRILYGGSVKPSNARDLFSQPDIDGGLIGGASLVAQDFLLIAQAAH